MRNQTAGNDPDRHERALARPRRALASGTGGDADDDAPTYVDEATNDVVSRDEFDALARGSAAIAGTAVDSPAGERDGRGGEDGAGAGVAQGNDASAGAGPGQGRKQEISEVGGAQRKRKAVRVVGAGGDADADVGAGAGEDGPAGPMPKVTPKTKPAKRVKKDKAVKLSFDDDGEDNAT